MSFSCIAAAEESLLPELAAPGRTLATLAYSLDRPFPAPRRPLRGGCMVLGGRVRAGRAAETISECHRRGIGTVILGFSPCPGLELLRFCEALRRRGIHPVVAEQNWQEGCGAAMLLSTAISGGTLRQRLLDALSRCGEICLDLERTRRSFPLPCPDGTGSALTREELDHLTGEAESCFFSPELQCKVLVHRSPALRFILFDDAETLRQKISLASELGIRQGFLLVPGEWSKEELRELETG